MKQLITQAMNLIDLSIESARRHVNRKDMRIVKAKHPSGWSGKMPYDLTTYCKCHKHEGCNACGHTGRIFVGLKGKK